MAHQEFGHRLIQKAIADLADIALVESPPRSEGRTLSAVLMPRPAKTGAKTDGKETAAAAATTAAPAKRATVDGSPTGTTGH
jgi:translation initiation factor IF-3